MHMSHIFGVPIYTGKLRTHDKIEEAFEPFVNDDSNFHIPEGWESTATNTFEHPNNKNLPWKVLLQDLIPNHFQPFLKAFKPRGELTIDTQAWVNKYAPGQFQETHNHVSNGNHFSFNYILKAPTNSGHMSMIDTSHDFWEYSGLNELCNVPYVRKYIPTLFEGGVIIFPSHLEHFVSPNLSNDTRITLSGNFMLRR